MTTSSKLVGYLDFSTGRFVRANRPRVRRHLVAVLPDGAEHWLYRRNDGCYLGPTGTYCSPLNYALEKWRAAGAKIERREVAAR